MRMCVFTKMYITFVQTSCLSDDCDRIWGDYRYKFPHIKFSCTLPKYRFYHAFFKNILETMGHRANFEDKCRAKLSNYIAYSRK